jgi:hypothetical protein
MTGLGARYEHPSSAARPTLSPSSSAAPTLPFSAATHRNPTPPGRRCPVAIQIPKSVEYQSVEDATIDNWAPPRSLLGTISLVPSSACTPRFFFTHSVDTSSFPFCCWLLSFITPEFRVCFHASFPLLKLVLLSMNF